MELAEIQERKRTIRVQKEAVELGLVSRPARGPGLAEEDAACPICFGRIPDPKRYDESPYTLCEYCGKIVCLKCYHQRTELLRAENMENTCAFCRFCSTSDKEGSFRRLLALAETRKSAAAQLLVALNLMKGDRVERDLEQAARWFHLAADQGDVYSSCEPGKCT